MSAASDLIRAFEVLDIELISDADRLRVRAAPEAITLTARNILENRKKDILPALANSRNFAPNPSAGPAIHMSWLAPTHPALAALDPDKWPWQVIPAAIYAAHRYSCLNAEMLAAAVVARGAKELLLNRGEIDKLAAKLVLNQAPAVEAVSPRRSKSISNVITGERMR